MTSVLIIEDTLELAEVIEATLESMGLDTVHETHGARAIERFYDVEPDLILLDIGLPDMPGWEILHEIKAYVEQTGASVKVIVITAYDDPANRLVGKLQDVHSYLVKPFTSHQIENVVYEVLHSQV